MGARGYFSIVKLSGSETDHLPPSSAEFENGKATTPTLLIGVALNYLNNDMITFIFHPAGTGKYFNY
jgi:hypothetical protein